MGNRGQFVASATLELALCILISRGGNADYSGCNECLHDYRTNIERKLNIFCKLCNLRP